MFKKVFRYYFTLALVHLFYTILLTIHILYIDNKDLHESGFHVSIVGLMLVLNIIFIFYSQVEIWIEKLEYLNSVWNYIDTLADWLLFTYSVMFLDEDEQSKRNKDRAALLAAGCFFVYIRLIGFFRLHKSSRYYIRMIIHITEKVKYFILILATCTLATSFSLKALRQNQEY